MLPLSRCFFFPYLSFSPDHFHFMYRYIDEQDLSRFMIREEVDLVFPLIEGSEKGQIDKKALTDWVVRLFLFCLRLIYCLLPYFDQKSGGF